MTLMPGLEHLGPRLELVEGRRAAVDLPVVVRLTDSVGVEGLAQHVEHVAEHGVAHRHRDPAAQVAHRRAAHQAVGLLHADAADPALADLLGHLGRHGVGRPIEVDVELDLVVDLGQGVGWELDVDHRSGDRNHPAFLARDPAAVGLGAVVVIWSSSLRLAERFGSANNLHDLGGDGVLTGAVHDAGQGADQFVRVLGGGRHGPLLSGEERGRPFEQGGEDLGLERPAAPTRPGASRARARTRCSPRGGPPPQ